ncbi:hypothetical protein [Actinomadura rubrisoli]|uniref:DUF3298 domain-containing protein n=1 Tax=Actinomadura rubrisoli TaxID=2530368 RepID=A0A4R5AW05_9ACTN|nr:hypothetical protein [Actinomadura rubrisoli]TDD75344.1 hypothetical protein E1298_31695 [Actinomadura rubrisoli]
MRARLTGKAAMPVVSAAVAMAAAVTGCSSSGDGAKGGQARGPVVQRDDTAHPDKLVQLRGAEYVKIAGLADAAASKRLDAALRAPLDWAVTWAWKAPLKEQLAECKGKPSVLQSKVRLGLRGDIVSVANAIGMVPCYEGEGSLPTVPVTVDVKAGKALAPQDVFNDTALSRKGLAMLWARLAGPKDDWRDCELDPPRYQDLFPGKRDGEPIESPAPFGLFFTAQGLEVIWSTTGTGCNNFTFTVAYEKVKDLIKPEVYPRLLAAATAR